MKAYGVFGVPDGMDPVHFQPAKSFPENIRLRLIEVFIGEWNKKHPHRSDEAKKQAEEFVLGLERYAEPGVFYGFRLDNMSCQQRREKLNSLKSALTKVLTTGRKFDRQDLAAALQKGLSSAWLISPEEQDEAFPRSECRNDVWRLERSGWDWLERFIEGIGDVKIERRRGAPRKDTHIDFARSLIEHLEHLKLEIKPTRDSLAGLAFEETLSLSGLHTGVRADYWLPLALGSLLDRPQLQRRDGISEEELYRRHRHELELSPDGWLIVYVVRYTSTDPNEIEPQARFSQPYSRREIAERAADSLKARQPLYTTSVVRQAHYRLDMSSEDVEALTMRCASHSIWLDEYGLV